MIKILIIINWLLYKVKINKPLSTWSNQDLLYIDWEVTLFLNYIVRVWPLSLMLLNNLQWFSMTISNKVNATQWVCQKMEPLHTENRVVKSHFSVIRGYMLQRWGTFNFWFTKKKKKKKKSALFQSYTKHAIYWIGVQYPLKGSQLPKMKKKCRFFTCHCHKLYRVEAVDLSLFNYT